MKKISHGKHKAFKVITRVFELLFLWKRNNKMEDLLKKELHCFLKLMWEYYNMDSI